MHAPTSLLPLLVENLSYMAGGRSLIADANLRIEPGPPTAPPSLDLTA